jgi:hypothetical protein
MYKYIYISKKNGMKFYFNDKQTDEDLELVMEVRDGMMRSEDKNVINKNERQAIYNTTKS